MGAPKAAAKGPAPGGAAVPMARAKAILASSRRAPPPPRVAGQRVKAFAVLTAPVTWLLVFLLIPLVLVAMVGFATVQATYLPDVGRPTLSHYIAVFNPSGEAFRLLLRSLMISVEATAMSLVVGYASAYYIARLAKEKWKGTLMALIVIPFWVTFIVRIYGLILFVRPEGFIDSFFRVIGLPGSGSYFVQNFGVGTDALLVFTLVYVWLPFMVLPLFTALSKVDAQLLEAASDLGASRLRTFWNVTLPLTLPGIVTGSIFVFITTLGSFVEPQFLSAAPMIGNFVENQFSGAQGVGIPIGAAASMFIIVSTMLLVTVYTRYAELEETGAFGKETKISGVGQVLRLFVFGVAVLALAVAGVYLLEGAILAGSVGGVLDASIELALLYLLANYVVGEAFVAAHSASKGAARQWAADALGPLLFVAAAWLLGHGLLFTYDAARGGLSAGNLTGIVVVLLFSVIGALFVADMGVVVYRHRQEVASQPLTATLRLLVEGAHPLAWFVGGSTRVLDRVAERAGRYLLAAFTAITLLIFFVPLILMGIFSFTAGQNPSAWEGFSLQWYIGGSQGALQRDYLFHCDAVECSVLESLGRSAVVGVASAFLSLFFGMLAAFAINRYVFRGKSVLNHVMYLGLVIPSIVMGISLSILVRLANETFLNANGLQWDFGLMSLIIGHTTFNIPLATLVLLISFQEFDKSLEEAAMNLGAGPLTTFFRVTLPNIKAGIVSTLLLTFTFSFDEFPVSLFLAGSAPTYPIIAWGLLSKKIPTPEANAAATLILVISLVFTLLATRISKGGAIFRI